MLLGQIFSDINGQILKNKSRHLVTLAWTKIVVSDCNLQVVASADIIQPICKTNAEWIRLCLTSCRHRFESQAYHLRFYQFEFKM